MADKTICDIATMANVSPSTVSRVINNRDNVSQNTKKKVQKILKENNFVINEAARGSASSLQTSEQFIIQSEFLLLSESWRSMDISVS